VAILDKGRLIALNSPAALCQGLGEFVVEWSDGEATNSRFFSDRAAAAQFAATLTATTTIRLSNLEDVFVELTGRKVVG
jgi:ABC-2 type transport system ATP-binding protein